MKKSSSSTDFSSNEDCSLVENNSVQEITSNKESLNRAVTKSSTIRYLTNDYATSKSVNIKEEIPKMSDVANDKILLPKEQDSSLLSKEAWKEIKLQTYTTEIFSDINKTLSMSTIIPETNYEVKIENLKLQNALHIENINSCPNFSLWTFI